MSTTTLTADLTTIVAGAVNAPRVDGIQPGTALAAIGFDVPGLLAQLGVRPRAELAREGATLAELRDAIHAEGDAVAAAAHALARAARLRRIVQAVLLARGQAVAPDPDLRSWNDLVVQVLWWTARESGDDGLALIRQGAPGRALQALSALGVLAVSAIREASDRSARTFLEVLGTCGYPPAAARDAWVAMGRVADAIQTHRARGLQRLLRGEAEELARRVEHDLLPEPGGDGPIRAAVRTWLRNATALPLPVFSPSTRDFVAKFRADGASEDALVEIGDRIGFALLDSVLADFMDNVCRGCQPGDPDQRRCADRLGRTWQVECPRHAAAPEVPNG